MERIIIKGAREHNLKGVDLAIPGESLVVITGVSGSGKSSLAFDTLFREGQRRYLESLSPYARQFLGRMVRPKVDVIDGLSPAISIDQKTSGRSHRSTVGTMTEIYDFLRLLFSRLGEPHCPGCSTPITSQTPEEITDRLLLMGGGKYGVILAPVVRHRKGEYRRELEQFLSDGYTRVRIDGNMHRLDRPQAAGAGSDGGDAAQPLRLDRYSNHTIEIVVDRVRLEPERRSRLHEAVERALGLADGLVHVLLEGDEERRSTPRVLSFSSVRACASCGFSLAEIEPRLFSFNTPWGWCERCRGLGIDASARLERLVPDPGLSLRQGALEPLQWDALRNHSSTFSMHSVRRLSARTGLDMDAPWAALPEEMRNLLLHGSGDGYPKAPPFEGVVPALEGLWRRYRYPYLERWVEPGPCPDCGGTRLRREALAVRFRGRRISDYTGMTVVGLMEELGKVELSTGLERDIGAPIFREALARLRFLDDVGLGYLSLDRTGATLAGGEAQRIRLASQVGAGLQGILYVLDEPSVGLHPRDNERLIRTLRKVRDSGNTVVVVEHDEETMRAADLLVDMGPGAGEQGGHITACGTPSKVMCDGRTDKNHPSVTARFLSGREEIPVPAVRRPGTGELLRVVGARHHNLKNLTAEIPVGCLVVVTGVSGSGKSTLVDEVLREGMEVALRRDGDLAAAMAAQRSSHGYGELEGSSSVDKVIVIDQNPIGRTPRSNPATYVGVFTPIRELFAELPEARVAGFNKSRFSFNLPGGRCAECDGAGVHRVEMEFLADVEVTCDVCNGDRFSNETLRVKFKGRNIAQVLDMTVSEAVEFFRNQPKIFRIFQVMESVGLGYLRLSQSSTTLSGGQAQRVKLAAELRKAATGHTLYLLDEPTTGLHAADVRMLLDALDRLVEEGNTVLVVEHNLDVIKSADHILDLGPEGGEGGGRLVARGTPEEVAATPGSHTGAALAQVLAQVAGEDGRGREAWPGDAGEDRGGLVVAQGEGTAGEVACPIPDPTPPGPVMRDIVVKGARRHNLKDADVTIPGGTFTVISGVSGSGKSSLAMDTIFSEGQRRYVESLSTYARRFLGRLDRAPVDSVHGLAPAVAVDQKSAPRNPRSTVATVTEIHDHLRLLFSRAGNPHCPICDEPLSAISPAAGARLVKAHLEASPPGWRPASAVLVCAPPPGSPKPPSLREAVADLLGAGRLRVLVDGRVVRLDGDKLPAALLKRKDYLVIFDRLMVDRRGGGEHDPLEELAPEIALPRLTEALQMAYHYSGGIVRVVPVLPADGDGQGGGEQVREVRWDDHLLLTERMMCPDHGFRLEEPYSPRAFSFNHHEGACPTCQGLGVVLQSKADGDSAGTVGVRGRGRGRRRFRRRRRGDAYVACPGCGGARLKPGPLGVKVGGLNLVGWASLTVARVLEMVEALLGEGGASMEVAHTVLGELRRRLAFLVDVGLYYLTLDRSAATLSGGEAQRIRLASQIGSGLTGCIYVLDEPTIGLHPRDNRRLIGTLERLRDLGNTVLVVEHDLDTIRAADHLLDMGPGAGVHGGKLLAAGPPGDVANDAASVTGAYLSGRREIPVPGSRRSLGGGGIGVIGASANNLKGLDAFFPWGCITAVTGVSGSGKSSLVIDVLQKGARAWVESKRAFRAVPVEKMEGLEDLREVVVVDQAPIGRTPRSIPATYIGILSPIRTLFASTREARLRGYGVGRFSFNVPGGRCAACDGMGAQLVEMHFLSDVWVPCEVCKGSRFNRETLAVRYRGRSISEVLHMEVEEARDFFRGRVALERRLQPLVDVGLGYLRLDQSADTLSGGEAQRLKLAAQLSRPGGSGSLIVLDEPTTGLHPADVERLVEILHRLAERGAAVVVVEHNMDVVKVADQLIDLGPEGGEEGGRLIGVGTPEQIARTAGSHTGAYLASLL